MNLSRTIIFGRCKVKRGAFIKVTLKNHTGFFYLLKRLIIRNIIGGVYLKSINLSLLLLLLSIIMPISTANAVDLDSSLFFAIWEKDWESVESFLEAGANVNATDSNGNTPLIWAAWSGNLPIVLEMITRGANICTKNHYGETAMDFAKARNYPEILHNLRKPPHFESALFGLRKTYQLPRELILHITEFIFPH